MGSPSSSNTDHTGQASDLVHGSTPEELAGVVQMDVEQWRKVMREAQRKLRRSR